MFATGCDRYIALTNGVGGVLSTDGEYWLGDGVGKTALHDPVEIERRGSRNSRGSFEP